MVQNTGLLFCFVNPPAHLEPILLVYKNLSPLSSPPYSHSRSFLKPFYSSSLPCSPIPQGSRPFRAFGLGTASSRGLQGPAHKSSVKQTLWQKWSLFYSKNLLHLSFLCQQNLDFMSPSWESRLRKERTGRKITHSAICMLESLRKRVNGREVGDHCDKEKISLFIHGH